MSTLFNKEAFEAQLGRVIHSELLLAAEPLVQQALKEIEDALRKRLAGMVVGFITTEYSVERDQRAILIRVQLQQPERKDHGSKV